jgi:hypothetical protein
MRGILGHLAIAGAAFLAHFNPLLAAHWRLTRASLTVAAAAR